MKIRLIEEADLDEVAGLLCEGFPRRSRGYWERALRRLSARPELPGFPRYGHAIEAGGALQGLALLISADPGQGPRCNLSSWYVREPFRKYAAFLFRASLRAPAQVFTDLSPAPHVLPIVRSLGFAPYTGGTLLLGPRDALRRGGRVSALDPQRLAPEWREAVARHLGYGCAGLLVEGEPVLWRIKRLKRLIPAARLVCGRPETVLRNAGGLMRALLARGIPLAMADAPAGLVPAAGRLMPEREIRYWKGTVPPETGDLLETEIAIFGP